MSKIKEGSTIECPYCKGKKGKTVLLYYWVNCYLCLGVGKIRIDKIIKIDEKRGDIKATFTVNTNNGNCPRLVTKTDWIFLN